jgi:hypothetical protein
MKEKKEHDNRTPYEEMLDAVIDARDSNPPSDTPSVVLHMPNPYYIHFTPGVPTEDGWYVVKSERNEYQFYETIIMADGLCITGYDGTILSHAKLPEL